MNRKMIGMLILASFIALGSIAAGCTELPGTTAVEPVSPARQATVADAARGVAAGNNEFAFDLYRSLANGSATENLFFSPFSISSALGITYEGARGETADEIRLVLHLPVNDTLRREGFAGINAGLNSGDANYTLRTANALWAEETYPFLPEYIETAERYYDANTTNLDFVGAPEESRLAINRWVEEQTEDRIQDLLPAGSITPLTRLVITNAIYFKGTWTLQFDANETEDTDFRVSQNQTVTVPMMQRTDEDAVYPYAETDSLQVLALPYASGDGQNLSMLVLLPKDGNLTVAEESLNLQNLSELRQSLESQRVDVYFPKFTLETEYGLPETLAAMGMPTPFTAAADFSGMDGSEDLFISDVVHKAFVDVNEEGTEAAAATGVVVSLTSVREDETPVFKADHPFVFLIQESETGNILFMGRVMRPEAA
ncbi:proteinase IV [Methanoculleus taiwanensis]|uniref:Proteinase IV n=1 Tax=Methanoculleus taiwanensis TaxID=1550565 RepID=A0A498H2R1_9EURY|nr:serpin family protein [Methanoculleus taiwanensis]RXE57359.1 proteinase IV [Methanoculleus taiwanensis]